MIRTGSVCEANESPRIMAVVPARRGSSTVRRKNWRKLGSKPLVSWTIDTALESAVFERVVISTDIPEIFDHTWNENVMVLPRPSELAGSNIHASHVVRQVLESKAFSGEQPWAVFMLLPTSPFRTAGQIRQAVDMMLGGAQSVIAVSETRKRVNQLRRFDYKSGRVTPITSDDVHAQRQDQDFVWTVSGSLFASRSKSFLVHGTFHTPQALGLPVESPTDLDIDSENDWNEAVRIARELEVG